MAEGICDYWALPHALHSEIRPNSNDCQVSNLHFPSIKKCNFIQHMGREQDFHIPVQCLNPGYIFWVIKKLRTTSPQCQGDFGGLWNSLTCWCFVLDIGPCSDMNCPVTIDPPKCDCSPHVLTLWSTSVSDNVSHGSAELHGILGCCAADTSWRPDLGASALCSSLVR